MTEPATSRAGCGTLLAFGVGELAAAIVTGYLVYTVGIDSFGWQERNAVPIALFAGIGGAFVVDRWAKRVIGESLMRALFENIPTFP